MPFLAAVGSLTWFSGAAGGGVAEAQQAVTNPHGDITIPCADCHTTSSWTQLREPLKFEHQAIGFPVVEGHGAATCTACHESLVFEYVPTACADCHSDPHRAELGFGCESCHSPAGWQDRRAMYIFHFTTLFPLLGGHATLECDSCHRAAPPFEYTNTPTDCTSCHASDFSATVDPDHADLGFPSDCELCHSIDSWQAETVLDHALFFPLRGAHTDLSCQGCHADGFAGTPTECYDCHAADYEVSTNPDHSAVGIPTDCELCHTEDRWGGASFLDHDVFYSLTGAHGILDCNQCHADGFENTPTDCFACHETEYDSASEPDHISAGFGTDCETCHTTDRWQGAVFDHDELFRLAGAHRRLACDQCHSTGFAGTPTDCYSCHQSDYDNTTDPGHLAAGFPTDCEACHKQNRWEGAEFDHATFFVLRGAHQSLVCDDCHASGFAGTPTDCYSCHRMDYADTTDPDHEAAGFPTDCEACHEQNRWEGAVFDHSTFFVLESGHQGLECADCHATGFTGTPTDCFACHKADYDNSTDPDHTAAGFPTNCELCHRATDWDRGDFGDHDALYFPIFSGEHRGEWDTCSECHPRANDFAAFECINCHEHTRSKMDDKHKGVSQYEYLSSACLQCHPDGRESDGDRRQWWRR